MAGSATMASCTVTSTIPYLLSKARMMMVKPFTRLKLIQGYIRGSSDEKIAPAWLHEALHE
jgi:hypothetical protein